MKTSRLKSARERYDNAYVAALRPEREDAAEALEKLVRAGCNRSILVACMNRLAWAQRPGMRRVDVKKGVRALWAVEAWLRQLEASDLAFKIERTVDLKMLAFDIEDCAYAVQRAVPLADKRAARTYDDCLATLARYVERATGRHHDEEVSLIAACSTVVRRVTWTEMMKGLTEEEAAALPEEALDEPPRAPGPDGDPADAHSQWRTRHQDLLTKETALEQEWKAKARERQLLKKERVERARRRHGETSPAGAEADGSGRHSRHRRSLPVPVTNQLGKEEAGNRHGPAKGRERKTD